MSVIQVQHIVEILRVAIAADPDAKLGEIGGGLGLPPMKVINALYAGEARGLWTRDREADTVELHDNLIDYHDIYDNGRFGEELSDAMQNILEVVTYHNAEQQDVFIGQLMEWAALPPTLLAVALSVLEHSDKLHKYTLSTEVGKKKKNKKDIELDFLTLPENVGKKWGQKQLG